jgi:hypothetical protein
MKRPTILASLILFGLCSCESALDRDIQRQMDRQKQDLQNASLGALKQMYDCRAEFVSTFSAMSANASSLMVEQRHRLLVTAIMQRQKCEEKAAEIFDAGVAKYRDSEP